jgi:GTP-binding protein
MNILSAEFVVSSVNSDNWPKGNIPEFAFVGRSNVGKSSLINVLVNKRSLAKTSSMPGKTRTINHFIINKEKSPWYLVDLPGYGFANAPEKERKKWEAFTKSYLRERENLVCTFVLIDSRHSPQQVDLSFLKWMAESALPMAIIFTKTDKVKPTELEKNLVSFDAALGEFLDQTPNILVTSSSSRNGRDEVLAFISRLMP